MIFIVKIYERTYFYFSTYLANWFLEPLFFLILKGSVLFHKGPMIQLFISFSTPVIRAKKTSTFTFQSNLFLLMGILLEKYQSNVLGHRTFLKENYVLYNLLKKKKIDSFCYSQNTVKYNLMHFQSSFHFWKYLKNG